MELSFNFPTHKNGRRKLGLRVEFLRVAVAQRGMHFSLENTMCRKQTLSFLQSASIRRSLLRQRDVTATLREGRDYLCQQQHHHLSSTRILLSLLLLLAFKTHQSAAVQESVQIA